MAGDNDSPRIGTRLRRWRKARGLSQAELAERSGLPAGSVIYRYEAQRVVPGVEILVRLADALEIPLDALVRDHPLDMPNAPEEVASLAKRLTETAASARKPALAAALAVLDAIEGDAGD